MTTPWDFLRSLEIARANNKERGHAARMNANSGVTPEIGGVYTVSPCFVPGDRSWIGDLWEVVGKSGPNVLVKIHVPPGAPIVRMFREDERAWYPADEAFRALTLPEPGAT